jgi:hypothetical protein
MPETDIGFFMGIWLAAVFDERRPLSLGFSARAAAQDSLFCGQKKGR